MVYIHGRPHLPSAWLCTVLMLGLSVFPACEPGVGPSESKPTTEATTASERSAPAAAPGETRPASGAPPASASSPSLRADTAGLHERLLTLDTHIDTPAVLEADDWDITVRHRVEDDLSAVDLPRLREGGLDGGFWAIYTPQGPRTLEGHRAARDAALQRAMRIRELVARHGDQFALATEARDAEAIAESGRRVVYMSMENAYPLGADLSLLSTFYKLGVRMVGLVHVRNNDFADSSTDPEGPQWRGLSELGRQLVREANRLGMIVDASHASDEALDQLIALSKTPIILSHTSCKGVFDHPRNVDDARLRKLAASGGVVHINAYSDYLIATPPNQARTDAIGALWKEFKETSQDSAARAELARKRYAIDERYPAPRASLDDFMAHMEHALTLLGPAHVGVGADWDGGGGVRGMEDVSGLPQITARLLAARYDEQALAQIWSGNVLRLLRQVEAVRDDSATNSKSTNVHP